MSDNSHILGLPYIQPAQAQKHVTHNEAIRALDALVQLSVADRVLTAPPSTPTPGDRHIVANGATGLWAGQDNAVAVFETGTWTFYAPQPGWTAVVRAEGVALIWDGATWTAPSIDTSTLQNLPQIGVNTTADATNRLSVSSDATLLTNEGSDHRVVVNKAAASDTASLLFQTGYGGRAEMGTAGTDDFAIKTSQDGSSWNTGVAFDAATGRAEFPSGAVVAKRVDIGGRWSCFTNNRWVTYSTAYGTQSDNNSYNAGTGADPLLSWNHLGILVPEGAQLSSLKSIIRTNSAEVTAFDLRVYFQTANVPGVWSADGDVTRTLVASSANVPTTTGFSHLDVDLSSFVASSDGFVLVYIRPVGTLSATRYLYSAMGLSYLTDN